MNITIELTYKTPKGAETFLRSSEMGVKEAILIAEDLERTGRIKRITFIDSHDGTWTLKELNKYVKVIETEAHNVTVYFDGGFDLKTKKVGLGCAIYYEQNKRSYRLRKNAIVEGLNTNNEAEYAALHLGLQELELLGVHHLSVTLVGDSMVVLNQLNGEWPCYETELRVWADRIESHLERLGITPEYELVPRQKNREADRLASQALNEIEITSTKEIK